jgi:hypothetical protein
MNIGLTGVESIREPSSTTASPKIMQLKEQSSKSKLRRSSKCN